MLVLSRKVGERLQIGKDIVVIVSKIEGKNRVKLGVEAPAHVVVVRDELKPKEGEEVA